MGQTFLSPRSVLRTLVNVLGRCFVRQVPTPEVAAGLFEKAITDTVLPYHHAYFWGDRLLSLDKSAGFLSDPSFAAAYQAIRGSHQYDEYSSPHTISWRLHTLVWAARSAMSIAGDFVECGVFKGDMAWFVSQLIDLKSRDKCFWLYDTFAGFSDKYSSPDDFPENRTFFDFANKHYKDPTIYPYVCNRFRDRADIKVIKGVVPDVLREAAPAQIAFAHIDLNSPAAEVGALEFLFPRLSSGGLVVFDDYGWKSSHRQKEAEDEFMRRHGYEVLELPTGQGLVIKR